MGTRESIVNSLSPIIESIIHLAQEGQKFSPDTIDVDLFKAIETVGRVGMEILDVEVREQQSRGGKKT